MTKDKDFKVLDIQSMISFKNYIDNFINKNVKEILNIEDFLYYSDILFNKVIYIIKKQGLENDEHYDLIKNQLYAISLVTLNQCYMPMSDADDEITKFDKLIDNNQEQIVHLIMFGWIMYFKIHRGDGYSYQKLIEEFYNNNYKLKDFDKIYNNLKNNTNQTNKRQNMVYKKTS